MGCASSKPSSKDKKSKTNSLNKNKKSQSVENNSQQQHATSTQQQQLQKSRALNPSDSFDLNKTPLDSPANDKLNKPIQIGEELKDQIEQNQQPVIDYIVRIVNRDLNAELIQSNGSATQSSNKMASLVNALAASQDNYDLITDIASRALLLLSKSSSNSPQTYKELNQQLKSAQYLFKNQSNKNRICDLTVNTIKSCLDTINDEIAKNGRFDLIEFLNQQNTDTNQLTPPQTPETKVNSAPVQSTPNNWDNALLLSRAQANEVARILFLSNRARPVVHASPKAKDAYFVNKQLVDNTEVTVSREEIDEILNRFDDQPKYIELVSNFDSIKELSPISPNLVANNPKNLEDTPLLSSMHDKTSNLLSNFNDLNQTNQTLTENEEFTTVTQEITNETIHFISQLNDTQNDNLEESMRSDERAQEVMQAVAAISALAANLTEENQLENSENNIQQEDSSSNDVVVENGDLKNQSEDNNDKEKNTIIFKTTTVITTTTLTTSIDTDNNNVNNDISNDNLDNNINDNSKENEQNIPVEENHKENGVLDPILKQSLLDDRFYNNDSFKNDPPVNGDQVNQAATTIQSSFKGHSTPEEIDENKLAEHAATAIQATYRGYKTRKDLNKQKHEQRTPSPQEIHQEHHQGTDAAATLIQATYRGFKTRKQLKKGQNGQEEEDEDLSLSDLAKLNERNLSISSLWYSSSVSNSQSFSQSLMSVRGKLDKIDDMNEDELLESKTSLYDSRNKLRYRRYLAKQNRKLQKQNSLKD